MAKRLFDLTLEGVAEWLLLQQGCAAAGRLGSELALRIAAELHW